MEKNNILKNIDIVLIKLCPNFIFAPYLHWFNDETKTKICSYYQYKDRLIAFTSQLLQRYYVASLLNVSVNQLQIAYTQYHKPFIVAPEVFAKKLNFNVAHSQDYVVIAVYHGNDYHIGVDIEPVNYELETNEMSPIVFSPLEQELIGTSKDNFFKIWTKKESLIKALGTGFATDFYQDTMLSLDDIEENNEFLIVTQRLENYFFSVCLHKMEI